MMRLLAIVACFATGVEAYCGTCGESDCSDCDRPDYGSCGNACCKLDWTIGGTTTTEVVATLNATLADGGLDGAFTPSALAEGTTGFADLRYADKAIDYIGQYIHMTSGDAHYNDSISLTVAPTASNDTVVRIFSYSLIGGAYGDAGQNYKNIKMIVDLYAEHATPESLALENVDASCPE